MLARPEEVFFKDRRLFLGVALLVVLFGFTSTATIKGGLGPFLAAVAILVVPKHRTEWRLTILSLTWTMAAVGYWRDVRAYGFEPWRLGLLLLDCLVATWFCMWVWRVRQVVQDPADLVPTYRERCDEARRRYEETRQQEQKP
jgi:hypothetical protein